MIERWRIVGMGGSGSGGAGSWRRHPRARNPDRFPHALRSQDALTLAVCLYEQSLRH